LVGIALLWTVRQEDSMVTPSDHFTLGFEGSGGSARGTIEIDTSSESLCLSVPSFNWARAAHVHNDLPGPQTDVVIATVLEPPNRFRNQMCVPVPDRELAQIVSDPSDYYVDVHKVDKGRVSSWAVLTPADDGDG
jgi:hypothetical protein